jgi:tetratricopeptide (TPR) repeat protein
LNQANADMLMERFVSDYPTSAKVIRHLLKAHYYFDQGNYTQALQWFEKVNESQLSGNDRDKFNFKKTVSLIRKKKEATTYFNKVVNSQEYGSKQVLFGLYGLWGDDYKEATKFLMPFLVKKIQRKAFLLPS